ncbi:hypothetical protein KY321_01045 [Candidatus Woesearchaeota archaeon]|nr:hypothetical protein [Candidatus Woesearchaeota archaeon]
MAAKSKKTVLPKRTGLLSVFGKIKRKIFGSNETEKLIDEVTQEQEKLEEEKKEWRENANLRVDVDKIKAQLEALDVARKVTNERFIRVGEQLGELRTYLLSLEKEMKDVMINVAKSVDLVQAVQPQKLLGAVEDVKAHTEINKVRIEGNKGIMDKLLSELKEVRKKMALFRGVEQVLKILDEIKEKSIQIEKLKIMVEKQSDSVANTYTNVKKRYAEFKKYKELGKEMQGTVSNLTSDFEKVKAKMETEITPDNIETIEDNIEKVNEHYAKELSILNENLLSVFSKLNIGDKKQNIPVKVLNIERSMERFDVENSNALEKLTTKVDSSDNEVRQLRRVVSELVKDNQKLNKALDKKSNIVMPVKEKPKKVIPKKVKPVKKAKPASKKKKEKPKRINFSIKKAELSKFSRELKELDEKIKKVK